MIDFTTPNLNRRNMLSVGGLALGGLTLPDLLRAQDAVRNAGGVVRDKSVIFLFMHGGPSQFETFDPKMDAPSNIRSATGEIPPVFRELASDPHLASFQSLMISSP